MSLATLETDVANLVVAGTALTAAISGQKAVLDQKVAAAAGSAGAAGTSAGTASGAAAAALATRTAIDHRYRGALAADPATRTDGSANVVGDEVFNSTAGLLKRWNGTVWLAGDLNTANLASGDGAALVGDKGTTVSAALTLDKRRPRKLFSKLFASSSGAAHIRHVILGDSLANMKMQHIAASLDRRMGGGNASTVNTSGNSGGAGVSSGGFDLNPNSAVL